MHWGARVILQRGCHVPCRLYSNPCKHLGGWRHLYMQALPRGDTAMAIPPFEYLLRDPAPMLGNLRQLLVSCRPMRRQAGSTAQASHLWRRQAEYIQRLSQCPVRAAARARLARARALRHCWRPSCLSWAAGGCPGVCPAAALSCTRLHGWPIRR